MAALKDKIAQKVGAAKDDHGGRDDDATTSATNTSATVENSGGDDDGQHQPPDKYMVRVTAGPSYDAATHHAVEVNSASSLAFENDFMRVKLKVRIRDYAGLPRASRRDSAYFADPSRAKDLYSIEAAFVPKRDLPAGPARWGNDFDHPVRHRLPPGFNTAFSIVKQFIDPGLECDAYADKPWLLGPALSCWFAFRVGAAVRDDDQDFPGPQDEPALREGADGDGAAVRDRLGLPADAQKRRKFFLARENRDPFVFEKGRLYHADFHNPYLDFNNCAVKLPGFSLGVLRFTDDKTHTLRYVFKNVETGDVYFVVVLTCLFGEQLQEVLKSESA